MLISVRRIIVKSLVIEVQKELVVVVIRIYVIIPIYQ